jgi:hypothetical protein
MAAYALDWPGSATIVLLQAGLFFGAFVAGRG